MLPSDSVLISPHCPLVKAIDSLGSYSKLYYYRQLGKIFQKSKCFRHLRFSESSSVGAQLCLLSMLGKNGSFLGLLSHS